MNYRKIMLGPEEGLEIHIGKAVVVVARLPEQHDERDGSIHRPCMVRMPNDDIKGWEYEPPDPYPVKPCKHAATGLSECPKCGVKR